jgi:hypothetical protein
MGNIVAARNKIKSLASRIEKSLYQLKYGKDGFEILDDDLYFKIHNICNNHGIEFPLVKYGGEIYLDTANPHLFCILSKIAEEQGIVLNYEKTLE